MGRKGIALTLYTNSDLRILKAVIDTNDLKPIWEGPEPNLKNPPRQQKRKTYRSRKKRR